MRLRWGDLIDGLGTSMLSHLRVEFRFFFLTLFLLIWPHPLPVCSSGGVVRLLVNVTFQQFARRW